MVAFKSRFRLKGTGVVLDSVLRCSLMSDRGTTLGKGSRFYQY
jgi:hypothetical protein